MKRARKQTSDYNCLVVDDDDNDDEYYLQEKEVGYHCYLLQSLSCQKSTRSYIGFTTHPSRRIRQHNGDLQRGGAKRTSKFRPWKYLVIISGFPNKIIALQFEWQFQHPLESRIVRDAMNVRQKWSNGWKGKLEILSVMMEIKLWKQLQLTLNFLDENAYQWFRNHSRSPVEFMKTQLINRIEDIPIPQQVTRNCNETSQCSVCSQPFGLFWQCCDCLTFAHLCCTANQSDSFVTGSSLIPAEGRCHRCNKTYPWSEIVHRIVKNQQRSSTEVALSGTENEKENEKEKEKSVSEPSDSDLDDDDDDDDKGEEEEQEDEDEDEEIEEEVKEEVSCLP